MEMFTEIKTTYKTRANAVKKAEQVAEIIRLPGREPRWLIATTEDGRFFPVFIGQDSFDAVHLGVCIAG